MTPRQLIEPARLAGNALLHTQSDARLVDLARAGNDRAFEVIVARYRGPLLRYCERILPPGRAEDAVQQAFLNAYRAISRNEAELNLKPWLYRVAHNAALNLLRQNGWNYDEIPEDFDGVVQPPQALEQREQIRRLIESVQELPERQRDAIVLRELEGRSYEEIAAALGVTDGAVRQLLNRARSTLRSAATALTPPRLLESLIDRASSPTTAQIAEVSAGAGGAAGVVKLGAALVVAGAVGGAVVAGPAHHLVLGGSSGRDGATDALAATGGGSSGGGGGSFGGAIASGIGTASAHGETSGGGSGASGPRGTSSSTGPGGTSGPGGGGSGTGSTSSGPGGGGFADFNPGSGGGGGGSGPSGGGDGGGHGGSGSGSGDHSGSGDGHSGSGSGSSDGGSSSSGGGSSGSSDGGSSGSGGGDGSSGSGDSGSGFVSGVPTVDSSGSGDGGSSGSSDGGTIGGDMSGSSSGSDGGGLDHSGPGG